MFSGIVESIARVVAIEKEQENKHFTMESSIAPELKIDQSIAHNGVCLTVVAIEGNRYTVTAMLETLQKSNLGLWSVGEEVNIERSMRPEALLDGHIVQGHVDLTAKCIKREDAQGSWNFTFEYDPTEASSCTVEKGSVTVNGVSLTVCDSTERTFRVSIIPYTYEFTNFHNFEVGSVVNIEFDIIGKYIAKLMQNYNK